MKLKEIEGYDIDSMDDEIKGFLEEEEKNALRQLTDILNLES